MDETPIELREYDPAWREAFAAERERLRPWVGEYANRIEHVGSTSVPGLAAKPIVDITAVVTDVEGLWGALDKLTEFLGYRVSHHPGDWLFLQRPGESGDGGSGPGGGGGQPFNLHLVPASNDAWRRDLLFREYLREHPDARAEYADAKREAAAAHPGDIDAYNDAKADVCAEILDRALADDDVAVPAPEKTEPSRSQ